MSPSIEFDTEFDTMSKTSALHRSSSQHKRAWLFATKSTRLLVLPLALFTACVFAESQSPQQAPSVSPENQSERNPKAQQKANGPEIDHQQRAPVLPTAATPAQHQQPAKRAGEGEQEGAEFWSVLGLKLKITDTLLVIFTGLLFVATWRLWKATDRLVTGAEATAQRELRAYVSVDPFDIKDDKGINIPNKVAVRILNSGKTPAHKLSQWTGSEIKEFPLLSELKKPSSDLQIGLSVSVLNPQSERLMIVEYPVDNMIREMAKVENGQTAFYVWGEVHYCDIFDTEHITKFAFYIGKDGLRYHRLAYCATGNEAT